MNLRHSTRGLVLDPSDRLHHVWRQEAIGPYAAGHDGVRNDYYVVRTEHFEPEPTPDWELEGISECRWWTVSELLAAEDSFFTCSDAQPGPRVADRWCACATAPDGRVRNAFEVCEEGASGADGGLGHVSQFPACCAALGGHIAALEGEARRTPLRASPSALRCTPPSTCSLLQGIERRALASVV